jgi:hypothetical protein
MSTISTDGMSPPASRLDSDSLSIPPEAIRPHDSTLGVAEPMTSLAPSVAARLIATCLAW